MGEFWKGWWDFLGTGMRMDIPEWKGGAPEEGPSMRGLMGRGNYECLLLENVRSCRKGLT